MSAHHYLRSAAYKRAVADHLDEPDDCDDPDCWICVECGEEFRYEDAEPALTIPAGPVCEECRAVVCPEEEEGATDEAVD